MKWYLIPYIIGFAKVGFYLFSIHMIEKLTIEEINFIRHDIWKGNRKLPRERERNGRQRASVNNYRVGGRHA